jgi:hypothetical protein
MKRIRTRLVARDASVASRLAPTIFRDITDIPPNQMVAAAYARLRAAHPRLGSQYDWLARYREDAGLDGLEMSLVRSESTVNKLLSPIAIRVERDGDAHWEIDPRWHGSDAHVLFRGFRLPLFEVSKLEMSVLAREHGFDDLLELSWFCHSPKHNGTACGLCHPCGAVIAGGLGRRVPWAGRARYQARRSLRSMWGVVRRASSEAPPLT